jgi:hypothetical protein
VQERKPHPVIGLLDEEPEVVAAPPPVPRPSLPVIEIEAPVFVDPPSLRATARRLVGAALRRLASRIDRDG